MSTLKPDLTRVWAKDAPPGAILDPDVTDPGKVGQGWQAEIPPFEHFNFLQQWFSQGLAHINEHGICVWDAETIYPIDGITKGSDGQLYSSMIEQNGNNPVGDNGTNWVTFNLGGMSSVETTINTIDFGTVGDGVTDDTASLQSAIDYLVGLRGGTVIIPAGEYRLTETLNVPHGNIRLVGIGSDKSHDISGQGTLAVTEFKWDGVAGHRMLSIYSPQGVDSQKHVGCGVEHIYFNGNELAGIGLEVKSQNSGNYSNLYFEEFTNTGLLLTAHSLNEASDPQDNQFDQLSSRQYLTSGSFITLDGISNANASMNSFMNCSASFKDGVAYNLKNCDNNIFIRCRAFRTPSATGSAITCHGANSDISDVARSNLFLHFSTNNGSILALGTESYVHPSRDNRIIQADLDNNTPEPNIGVGSTFWFDTDRNTQDQSGLINPTLGSSRSQVIDMRSRRGSETVRVGNSSSNHVKLESQDGNIEWGVSISEITGDFRITRLTDTGSIYLEGPLRTFDQPISQSAQTGTSGVLPFAPDGYLEIEINGTPRKIPFYQ